MQAPARGLGAARGSMRASDDDPSFIVLTETKFSFAVYLFGIGTLLTGPGLKKKGTCDNALTMTSPVHW